MIRPITEAMRKPVWKLGVSYAFVLACLEAWFSYSEWRWNLSVSDAIAYGRATRDALSILPASPSLIEQWGIALAMLGLSPAARTVGAIADKKAAKKAISDVG